MQIVIDIPENIFNTIQADEMISREQLAILQMHILNGTPLPKGHGRLIDEERISLSGIHFETERDHAMMIGRLNSAPTIIEADKAESEDKE